MRLFDTDKKVGIFLDDISPRVEKRKGEEIKLVDLALRVQPLTVELAAAVSAGSAALAPRILRSASSRFV